MLALVRYSKYSAIKVSFCKYGRINYNYHQYKLDTFIDIAYPKCK